MGVSKKYSPEGPLRKNARLLLEAAWNFERDDGYAMASHIALAGLTAIFPFLIVVTSLAGLFGVQPLADEASSAFFDIWPQRVAAPILLEIHNVLSNRHGGLLTISAALAVYFSSSGVEALRTGLNRAYGAPETRAWWRLRIQSIGYVFIGALALLAMAFLLILGPILWEAALKQAPALGAFNTKVEVGRYAIATIILLAALIIAHRVLPNVKLTLRQTAPGVILTFCAWMIFASAFGSYIARFALNYVATYAGLASVMIAIVFLYSLAAIFIFGAELNAAIERRHRARAADTDGA
jgi:membrane protein